MFEGDDELNFTPEEAARVARAEGRTLRRRRAAPPTQERHGGAGGAVLGIFLALMLMLAYGELSRGPRTSPAIVPAVASTPMDPPTVRRPEPRVERPIQALPLTATPATSVPAPGAPVLGLAMQALPPGWDIGEAAGALEVLKEPRCGAPLIARFSIGTGFLMKRLDLKNPCWHVVATEDAVLWGYACLEPGARLQAAPVPPGWVSALHQGPALQLPTGLWGNAAPSVVRAGDQMVFRHRPGTDVAFVISQDGGSWGYVRRTARGGLF